MAQKLILLCCCPTSAMRRAVFPSDDAADDVFLERAGSAAGRAGRFDRVLTSPALRASQTARLFAPEPAPEPALADQDMGEWAGRSLAEIGQADPAGLAGWLSDHEARPPGGEAFAGVYGRAGRFLDDLLGRGGVTLAVTHPAVIRAAILGVLVAPSACFAHIDVAPLGATEFRGDGRRWTLRATGLDLPALALVKA